MGESRTFSALPSNPGDCTFFRFAALSTTGQIVVADATVRQQGALFINESTNDGKISTDGGATYMLLPKKANDLVTQVFVPGNGPIWIEAATGTIDVSGWYI